MNKIIVLLFLLTGCSFQILLGQRSLTKEGPVKYNLPFQQPPPSIALTPLVVTPRNIANDARNIKMASIDPVEQLDYIKKQCPFLKPIKSTLELEGQRADNETVNLNWKRENGIDDRLYFIERSFNDSLHFETVNNVWAYNHQKTTEKYNLPDDNNYDEISYYRLKLASFSNEVSYSNIVKVKGYAVETLAVYPNPAVNEARIKLQTKVAGLADVVVYDNAGRRLLLQKVMMVKGDNENNLAINHLLPGTYLVTIMMADKTIRKGKIIKE